MMVRRLRYQVAASLDGFIAGPNGEYDWIVMDPSIDFDALYKEFDTVVMGRKTYEVATAQGGNGAMPGLDVVVFSKSLSPATHKGVRIVGDDPRDVVAALKAQPGRDIWLFGGAALTTSMMNLGLVDEIWLAVHPILLGSGKYCFSHLDHRVHLDLIETKPYSTGLVSLTYTVVHNQ